MTRIIVHAGFHKTGTTTVQDFFATNREHIWPHSAIVIQHRIRQPLEMALAYSTGGGQLALDEFRFRFSSFLKTLDLGKKRALFISAENLSGMMPGKNALVDGYSACPILMKTVSECVKETIDPNPDMTFYFSTREKPAWLRSIWWHNLSKTRLTDDFAEFTKRLDQNCNLDRTVELVRSAVAPHPVLSTPLEQLTLQQFGPATPLVDLLDLPSDARNALHNIPPSNVMPSDELVGELLTLNRSSLSKASLVNQKKALLDRAREIS